MSAREEPKNEEEEEERDENCYEQQCRGWMIKYFTCGPMPQY